MVCSFDIEKWILMGVLKIIMGIKINLSNVWNILYAYVFHILLLINSLTYEVLYYLSNEIGLNSDLKPSLW